MRCYKGGIAILVLLRKNHCKGKPEYDGRGKKMSVNPPKKWSLGFLKKLLGFQEQKIKSEDDLRLRIKQDADDIVRSPFGLPIHPANR